jgi:DNA polymerase-3 subunit epsilon
MSSLDLQPTLDITDTERFMFEPRVVFLDLETTGASADRDRVTEVGLIEVANGEYTGEWSQLVNPERSIPSGIVTLTGISDEMVRAAPRFSEIAPELLERLEGRLLVAHNVHFDYAFLRAEFRRLGIRFRARTLCTVRLSRTLFPEHHHHNLDSVIERFSLPVAARHRALGDAQVLWAFARELQRRVEPERLTEAVAKITRAPVLPTGIDARRFEDLPIAPGVYAFYAQDGAPLYVGKGVNLRSRVLAHFDQAEHRERELRLALETASLEWVETAGELSMALRELALLRELTPRFNRRRRTSEIWSLRWQPGETLRVEQLPSATPELAGEDPVDAHYGAFRDRTDAVAALRGMARSYQLCEIVLGLQPGPGPCSAYAQGHCRGACIGAEHAAQHLLRTAEALARLRLQRWPYPARIGVREADPRRAVAEIHVLDQWRYLGTARTQEELDALVLQRKLPPFDLDVYRVLVRHLAGTRSALPVIDLSRQNAWDADG